MGARSSVVSPKSGTGVQPSRAPTDPHSELRGKLEDAVREIVRRAEAPVEHQAALQAALLALLRARQTEGGPLFGVALPQGLLRARGHATDSAVCAALSSHDIARIPFDVRRVNPESAKEHKFGIAIPGRPKEQADLGKILGQTAHLELGRRLSQALQGPNQLTIRGLSGQRLRAWVGQHEA